MREIARARLAEFIDRYTTTMLNANRADVSEETVRTWINELLSIFGWNVQNTTEVLQEHVLRGEHRARLDEVNSPHRKPDYILKNGSNIKTFLDAKSLSVNIFNDAAAAYQIRSYGWSAQSPCAFITNIEQFVIFDTRFVPLPGQSASNGALQLRLCEYLDHFDLLYEHLWRENVWNNHLYTLYETTNIEGSNRLDNNFMQMLSDFRIDLATNLVKHNMGWETDDISLNYYVQVILDRIIFIRVCESKGIEELEKLRTFTRSPEGFWNAFKNSCYMEFFHHYDGTLFDRDQKFQDITLND